MVAVNALVDKLSDGPKAASEAGALLLDQLSNSQLSPAAFLEDPLSLVGPPFFVSRYLAQVTLRAFQGEYATIEEVIDGLHALLERNPPTLEPGRQPSAERVVIPEAKVVELKFPARQDDGQWESAIVALVTSGALRGREVQLRFRSSGSRTCCFLVPYLWIHATFAAYNLISIDDGVFAACAESFLVIEPMRQVNATSVARSLNCTKPQLDQLRRGKGDVTIQTLRGTIVHSMFDKLLENPSDIDSICDEVLPRYAFQIASVVDEFFDENAFRAEVLRHITELKGFIEANPHLLEDTQLELKRYSATIGIQGRIDALFAKGNRLDILELKTGAHIRPEDHAQLFIYRLLLSDLIRRAQRGNGQALNITARLLSSTDGAFATLKIQTDFHQVLDARNKLVATQYALGRKTPHFKFRYQGFNEDVCRPCPSWMRNRCKETSDLFGDRPNAATTPELEYFRRFSHLVERERWLADQAVAELLDDSRTELRRRNFRTILNARIVEDAEPFTFEFEENTSDLDVGDAVLIHSGNISSRTNYHGYVREVETRRMRVSIPLKNLKPNAFNGQDWIIDRFPSDVTAEASHTALYDFLTAPMDAKKQAILAASIITTPLPPPKIGGGEASAASSPSYFRRGQGVVTTDAPVPNGLNHSQQTAVERAAHCDVFHLIWGPPGTGKTKVIPEIVRRVDGPILLGAFTNTAVDKMLIALVQQDPSVRFLRIGRASESPELAALLDDPAEYFSEDLALKRKGVHAVREAIESARIVAATAHRASTLPYLRRRGFEMVIADEAGQLTEPLTLGLILRGRRFVLIGDDRQLPPVVRTPELTRSMFERLKQDAESANSGTLTLLDTQYRMHPQIMAVSNRFFYDGRLRSGVAPDDRLSPDGRPLTLIPVEGESNDRKNPREAEAVVELVRHYRETHGVPGKAIGVVSPFRAQVVLLRKLLHDAGVTVDTVERFQGGERDIMILSLVRSRASGFVFDERRFNVAITRARRKLIVVAHPNLFRNSRYEWICTFTETPKTVGMI
jgi:DNA replication ATP-dependent helicase Dna2